MLFVKRRLAVETVLGQVPESFKGDIIEELIKGAGSILDSSFGQYVVRKALAVIAGDKALSTKFRSAFLKHLREMNGKTTGKWEKIFGLEDGHSQRPPYGRSEGPEGSEERQGPEGCSNNGNNGNNGQTGPNGSGSSQTGGPGRQTGPNGPGGAPAGGAPNPNPGRMRIVQ